MVSGNSIGRKTFILHYVNSLRRRGGITDECRASSIVIAEKLHGFGHVLHFNDLDARRVSRSIFIWPPRFLEHWIHVAFHKRPHTTLAAAWSFYKAGYAPFSRKRIMRQ